VIICAKPQPAHERLVFGECGQDENGHIRLLANATAHLPAVDAGQPNVEDDQAWHRPANFA